MKIRNAVDCVPKGKAFEKPQNVFENDQQIAQWAKRVIRKLDPIAPAEAPELQLACFLAASSVVGPDDQRIARMLGVPADRAALWAANLRRNGTWQDGKVKCECWFNELSGFVGFMLDTLVAEGLIERRLNHAGEAVYWPVVGREWWQDN